MRTMTSPRASVGVDRHVAREPDRELLVEGLVLVEDEHDVDDRRRDREDDRQRERGQEAVHLHAGHERSASTMTDVLMTGTGAERRDRQQREHDDEQAHERVERGDDGRCDERAADVLDEHPRQHVAEHEEHGRWTVQVGRVRLGA